VVVGLHPDANDFFGCCHVIETPNSAPVAANSRLNRQPGKRNSTC
jgi:hypothetical protein